MVKVSEFHKGIFVLENDVPVEVDAIDIWGNLIKDNMSCDDGCRIKDPKGIDLTPEWLQKCGFSIEHKEKIGKSWVIPIMKSAKRVLGVCNMTSRTLVTFVAEPGNIVMLHPIYYLHQLQNLYFALTGEELTIKS